MVHLAAALCAAVFHTVTSAGRKRRIGSLV